MNVFEQQKNAGEYDYEKTWKIFLSESVGISLSYAGKLKDLAFDLDPQTYPQFLRLGLSFSEIMSLKKDIIKMLNEEHILENATLCSCYSTGIITGRKQVANLGQTLLQEDLPYLDMVALQCNQPYATE